MRRVWEGLMTRLGGSSRFANRRRPGFRLDESLYSGNKAVNVLYGTESELLGGLASRNRLMRTDNSLAVSIVGFGLKTVMVYLSNYDSCLKTPNSEQPIAIEKESMRSV
jgi:hypothetical protein